MSSSSTKCTFTGKFVIRFTFIIFTIYIKWWLGRESNPQDRYGRQIFRSILKSRYLKKSAAFTNFATEPWWTAKYVYLFEYTVNLRKYQTILNGGLMLQNY